MCVAYLQSGQYNSFHARGQRKEHSAGNNGRHRGLQGLRTREVVRQKRRGRALRHDEKRLALRNPAHAPDPIGKRSPPESVRPDFGIAHRPHKDRRRGRLRGGRARKRLLHRKDSLRHGRRPAGDRDTGHEGSRDNLSRNERKHVLELHSEGERGKARASRIHGGGAGGRRPGMRVDGKGKARRNWRDRA